MMLEGQTLAHKLKERPLRLRKAVDLALQLAQGLAAVHEKGVIDRDLKPGNLFVAREGRLKILDFGIAKLVDERAADAAITQSGAIMGTVGYMSPEHVRGQRADHRTDIFSFGVILHQMIGGKAPFERHTPMETGSAILRDDPPPLPESVSAELESLVLRCLEKDPRDRFRTAHDLAFQLASLHLTATAPHRARQRRSRTALARTVVALCIAVAAALGYALHRPTAVQQPRFTRLSTLDDWPWLALFTPDGLGVLYTATRGERRGTLMSTRIDQPHSVPMGLRGIPVPPDVMLGRVMLSRGGQAYALSYQRLAHASTWTKSCAERVASSRLRLFPRVGSAPHEAQQPPTFDVLTGATDQRTRLRERTEHDRTPCPDIADHTLHPRAAIAPLSFRGGDHSQVIRRFAGSPAAAE